MGPDGMGIGRRCAVALSVLLGAAVPAAAQDRMDALIERLERQEREIQELRQEVKDLRDQGAGVPPKHPEYKREDGEFTLTDYESPRIRLDVSGQVNSAVNFAGDGRDTKAYFVDNDVSASRIRFAGVSTFDETWDLGSTLEVGLSPNNSFDVSQDDERAGDFISVRRAEVWALDQRFGRVMIGHGSGATNDIVAFDLTRVSGTIMGSGEFVAGGLEFTDGEELSGVALFDAFFNFDGDRQPRVRYDTPNFGPFQLAVSAGADQRYDLALAFGRDYDHWSGADLPGFTTIGGIGISRPNDDDEDYRLAGSWSILHDTSGVSLTLSGGMDAGTRGDDPYTLYGKLGWDTQLMRFGPTGFGVDYTWTENQVDDGDEGQTAGIAAVQVIESVGIELYSQFRWHTYDRDFGPDLDDLFLGTVGTRIRF